jgi:hypothetical protein
VVRYGQTVPQFTIKWPNGAELTYEGEVSFDELLDLLDRDAPPTLLTGGGPGGRQTVGSDGGDGGGGGGRGGGGNGFDYQSIEARFEEVAARTDVERVTVLAQVALDAGLSGIDTETAENIYRELGLRMPGNWRSTFSNAQTRGYLRNAERGVWRPTAAGENFARRGERRPSPQQRRRAREGAA